MSGWAGRFVSYGVEGAAETHIRVQDAWLRLFQERDPRGRFVMKMVRKADEADRSWPRAGARPCSVDFLWFSHAFQYTPSLHVSPSCAAALWAPCA